MGRAPDVARATLPSVVTFGRFCGGEPMRDEAGFEEALRAFAIGPAQLEDLAGSVIDIVSRRFTV